VSTRIDRARTVYACKQPRHNGSVSKIRMLQLVRHIQQEVVPARSKASMHGSVNALP
jgi:hypothetical protein